MDNLYGLPFKEIIYSFATITFVSSGLQLDCSPGNG